MRLKQKCQLPGCKHKAHKQYCKKHKDYTLARRFQHLYKSARTRNLDCDITIEQYRVLAEGTKCYYCGSSQHTTGHNLDRIDNNKGYVLGNVLPCCPNCNRLKSDLLSVKEMLFLVDFLKVVRNNNDNVWKSHNKQKQTRRRKQMAFKSISNEGREYKKTTDLAVGETLTGYYLSHEVSNNPQAKGAVSLIMRIDGKNISVSASGNIKYLVQDGKLVAGANTRITRLEDKRVKGMKSTQFSVEQDTDDVYSAPSVNELGNGASAPKTTISDKIAALKNGAATTRQ